MCKIIEKTGFIAIALTLIASTMFAKSEIKTSAELRKEFYEKIPTAQNHSTIDKTIQDLANRLFSSNKIYEANVKDVSITSFVDLHQFNKTTHFGRTIAEGFFDELFVRGFNVSDFRGQETISINKQGEYFLTRDIDLLDKQLDDGHVLVGTYTVFEDKVLINARIMDSSTGKILASARANYITDDCRALDNCKKPRKIQILPVGYKKRDIKKDYASISINKRISPKKQHFIGMKPLNSPTSDMKSSDDSNINIHQEEQIVNTKTQYPLINLIK